MADQTDSSKPDDERRDGARGQSGDDAPDSRPKDGQDQGGGGDGKDGDEPPKKPHKGLLQRPLLLAGMALVLIVGAVIALLWWLHARNFETTDDAYVDTHIVRIAPQISGQIVQVGVSDNQRVKTGDMLVTIDSAPAQAQVAQAMAQRAQAQTQVDNAQAQVKVDEAALRQARAQVAEAQAPAANAAIDLARYNALAALNRLAVAQQQLDTARAQAAQTAAQVAAAQREAEQRAAQIAGARAQVIGGRDQVRAAQAQLRTAGITLGYTKIVAPLDGYISNKTVALGNYAQPGTQLMAIVPTNMWITANFKETQLAHMRPGQPATVKVDACPGHTFKAHVDSIQRGSGQAFGILPPENATGNFVKVVQRVPVKIVLDSTFADCPLGPGLSVEPSVRIR